MREIKFRVWDEKLCIMFSPDNQIGGLWSIKESHNGIVKYEDGILMQFTGLKDKNGKEIYEGDILKGLDPNNEAIELFEVEWDNKYSGYFFEYAFSDYGRSTIGCGIEFGFEFEIIGNIYENPELMEG